MTEFYNQYEQEARQEQPAFLETKISLKKILLSIAIAIVVLVLFIVFGTSFGKNRMTASTLEIPKDNMLMQPVQIANDKVFKYDGQIMLDGKVYNVSLRIDGMDATDAYKIIKGFVSG